jgi:hypothetical protein
MSGTKTQRKFGGRPQVREAPDPGKRVHLSLAVPQKLKRDIEKEANARGWSISVEAAQRLQSTLSQDAVLGGPDVRNVALLVASSFAIAGQRAGKERGVRDWAKDGDCYATAALNAIEALLRAAPTPLSNLQVGAIESRVQTIFLNQQQRVKDNAR